MSEFYSARRTLLADLGGLAGMGLGALIAAMTVWKVLATGFRTGELEKAFAIFLSVVGVAAVGGGVLGLAGGHWAARKWERHHRAHRPVVEADDPAPIAPGIEPLTVTLGTFAVRPLSTEAQRALAIVQREGPAAGAPWGAWDGPRLVAVAWVRHDERAFSIPAIAAETGYDAARIGELVLTAAKRGAAVVP